MIHVHVCVLNNTCIVAWLGWGDPVWGAGGDACWGEAEADTVGGPEGVGQWLWQVDDSESYYTRAHKNGQYPPILMCYQYVSGMVERWTPVYAYLYPKCPHFRRRIMQYSFQFGIIRESVDSLEGWHRRAIYMQYFTCSCCRVVHTRRLPTCRYIINTMWATYPFSTH